MSQRSYTVMTTFAHTAPLPYGEVTVFLNALCPTGALPVESVSPVQIQLLCVISSAGGKRGLAPRRYTFLALTDRRNPRRVVQTRVRESSRGSGLEGLPGRVTDKSLSGAIGVVNEDGGNQSGGSFIVSAIDGDDVVGFWVEPDGVHLRAREGRA